MVRLSTEWELVVFIYSVHRTLTTSQTTTLLVEYNQQYQWGALAVYQSNLYINKIIVRSIATEVRARIMASDMGIIGIQQWSCNDKCIILCFLSSFPQSTLQVPLNYGFVASPRLLPLLCLIKAFCVGYVGHHCTKLKLNLSLSRRFSQPYIV